MLLSPKELAQSLLKKIGLYQRVKSSRLYDFYWTLADRQLIEAREQELAFFWTTLVGLPKNALIFDIGANQGYKTDIFLRLGARVIAVDPDHANQEILKQNFLHLRLRKKSVIVVGKAVSDRSGSETMWIDEPGSAKNTLNQKWVETLRGDDKRFGNTLQFREKRLVETTTLEELIATYGRPFYIKIDVEGYEPTVLGGLYSPVPYLSFEVNLPEFRTEGERCIALLSAISPKAEFSYKGMEWSSSRGLEWQLAEQFNESFDAIDEPSVEVFCRTLCPNLPDPSPQRRA